MNILRRLLLCFLFLGLSCKQVHAEALYVEYFDYPDGELSAVSSNAWVPALTDDANPNLNVIGGQLLFDYTEAQADPVNNGFYGAEFSASSISSGSLYLYFDLEVTEAPSGMESTVGRFFSLWNGGNGYRSRCWIGTAVDSEGAVIPNHFRIGITEAAGSRVDVVWFPENWIEGTRLSLVVRTDFEQSNVSLFVNPTSESDTSITVDDGTSLGIKGVAVRHKEEFEDPVGLGVFRMDNIAVTQAFGDVDAPPSLPPNRLVASGVPDSSIAINWNDNSSSETGFRIERRIQTTSTFAVLAEVPANETYYLDTSVEEGVAYSYRVTALGDPELVSEAEAVAEAFAEAEVAPVPVVSANKEDENASLLFNASSGVVYEIQQSEDLENWNHLGSVRELEDTSVELGLEPGASGRKFARVVSSSFSVPPMSIGLTEAFKLPENGGGSIFKLGDYGATVDDSSNDDSEAFSAAFAAMSFGDVLQVAAGEYHLKSRVTIPAGLTVIGAENEGSVLNTIGTSTALKINPGAQDITVSNLVIIGEDDLLDYGVFVGDTNATPPQRIWIKDLRIERFNKRAIQVRAAKHVKIESCRILNALQLGGGGFGYGVTLNDAGNNNNWVTNCFIGPVIRHGILIQFSAHNNLIEGNTCFETTEDAYDLHGEDEYGNELRFNLAYWDGDSSTVGSPSGFGIGNTGATHDNSGPANWIHNNEVRGYQIGIEVIQESHIQFIDGNTFTDNADAGVKIHNGSGNSLYIRRNSITGSSVGIQASRSAGLVVEENTITGNVTGIVTSSEIKDYRIIENDLRGNGTAKSLGSDAGEFSGNLED